MLFSRRSSAKPRSVSNSPRSCRSLASLAEVQTDLLERLWECSSQCVGRHRVYKNEEMVTIEDEECNKIIRLCGNATSGHLASIDQPFFNRNLSAFGGIHNHES